VSETRAASAETRTSDSPVLTYDGTWEADRAYRRGAVMTDRSALWHSQVEGASDRPGSSSAWKLMAKTTQGSR
jgi:hypothetical protein